MNNSKDYGKYIFDGAIYGKSKLVFAVVKKYMQDNPNATYLDLLQVFPDRLQPRFGVIRPLEDARDKSRKQKRFYIDGEYVLKTGDGIKIAVNREFGIHNISDFLGAAKLLGYNISLSK
jgi:hypothetical protein